MCFSGISTISLKNGYIATNMKKIDFSWADISSVFLGALSHCMAGSDRRKMLTNICASYFKIVQSMHI
jgi:hypothetical protein